MTGRTPARSLIERVASVLQMFGASDGSLSASEISRGTGIPMASAHRIVQEFVRTGILERDGESRVRVGMQVWEAASRSAWGIALRDAALPYLEDLAVVVNLPTLLSILDQGDVVNLETLTPRGTAPVNLTQPGVRLPVLVSSPGIAMLAFSPGDFRDHLLETAPVTRFTGRSGTPPEWLRKQGVSRKWREMWTVSTSGRISGHVPRRPHAWRAPGNALVQTVFIRTLITGKQGTEPGRSIEQVSNTRQYL